MGNKEWILDEVYKDLKNKLIELTSVLDLLRDYSDNIKKFIKKTDNLRDFLSKQLGVEIKKIEEIINSYLKKQIDLDDFIKRGLQILGKQFLLIFIDTLRTEISSPKKSSKPVDKIKD